MSAPQGLLVATAVTGYVSWSYSSAAKLQDNMETQVYVRSHLPRKARANASCVAWWPAQGYPLRMEEEVKQLHKLAELQRSKDAAMEVRQADEAKSAMKAK